MTSDEFHQIAWADFMKFALEEPGMRAEFQVDTGTEFNDSAAYVVKFVEWATRKHYGLEYAPEAYRKQLEAKEPTP